MLEFAGKRVKPDIRKLDDMKEVIYDKKWLKTARNNDLYYMYRSRGVCKAPISYGSDLSCGAGRSD